MSPPPTKNTSDTISWIIRIGSFIMSIAIMVSSWFLNQAWDRINDNENEIQSIKLEAAETKADRFRSTDWVYQKSVLDNERLLLDRRLMRLEESLPVIKDSLIEIKQEINRHK